MRCVNKKNLFKNKKNKYTILLKNGIIIAVIKLEGSIY